MEMEQSPHHEKADALRKLDVGCGANRLDGAIGIDWLPGPAVDCVHDVNVAPWPLPDNSFEYIRSQHSIEHFREVHLIAREMWRVAKDQALVELVTPHYSSYASWGDPTHLHHFALASLPILFEQALGTDRFQVLSCELRFTGSLIDFFGWAIYRLSPRRYEKHFAWIFPANEIHVMIRLNKPKS